MGVRLRERDCHSRRQGRDPGHRRRRRQARDENQPQSRGSGAVGRDKRILRVRRQRPACDLGVWRRHLRGEVQRRRWGRIGFRTDQRGQAAVRQSYAYRRLGAQVRADLYVERGRGLLAIDDRRFPAEHDPAEGQGQLWRRAVDLLRRPDGPQRARQTSARARRGEQ